MAGEWRSTSLGELCEFRAGSVFNPALQGRASGEYPFVKVSDMNLAANAVRIQDANNWVSREDVAELRAKPFPPGTVVFAKIGEALRQNRLRQVSRQTLIDNNMMGAIPRVDRVDARFFYYALSQFDFAEIAQGTALPYLTVTSLSALTLDVPPADEQRAIAHILGTLDDKIELNRRMSETLEAMARALFKSWFVDFDPVRAKMQRKGAGTQRQYAKTQGRKENTESFASLRPGDLAFPPHILDLFPARLVPSELGEIPEGWEVGRLEDYSMNFDSKRVPLSGSDRAKRKGPFPYHGAAGVMDYVDNYLFEGVYLLVGEDGSVMSESGLAVTQYVWGKFWVNNHAHVLQGKNSVSTEQLYLYFCFEPVAPYVTGAVQPKLSQGRMNNMPFVFAGKKVCLEFHKRIEPLFAKFRACAEESRTLAALRDALLPKLISGELRVKDADKFIGRRV